MAGFSSLLFSLMSLAANAPASPVSADALQPPAVRFAQMSIRRSLIVKVPLRPVGPPIKWVEKGSRRCVDVDAIAGASAISADALDLILIGGERWRLKFRDECPAISFYHGFYLRPGPDRQLCAKRDVIHPRSGGECEIQTFRGLKPKIDD